MTSGIKPCTQTNQINVEIKINKRRWGWRGHALRKPNSNITKHQYNQTGLDVEPLLKEKEAEAKHTWRRDLETGSGANNIRGLLETGDVGEKLYMAYAPGGVKGTIMIVVV